jgi:hypothetical protein
MAQYESRNIPPSFEPQDMPPSGPSHLPSTQPVAFEIPATISEVGWSAVFAGFVVAVVTQLVLSMLGLAIGATALDPSAGGNPSAGALTIGAGVWTLLSSMIAVFIGAWVAGRFTYSPERQEGPLQGVLVWALSLLFAVWIMASGATALGSAALGSLAAVAQGAAQGAVQSQQQSSVQEQGQAGGPTANIPTTREEAINTMMQQQGISRAEAEQRVDRAMAAARGAADTAATVGATAAWWAFFTAMFSLLAGYLGGYYGARGGGVSYAQFQQARTHA